MMTLLTSAEMVTVGLIYQTAYAIINPQTGRPIPTYIQAQMEVAIVTIQQQGRWYCLAQTCMAHEDSGNSLND